MDIQIVETKRGKPAILHLGHRYTKKRIFQNTNILWTCTNRSCPGTLTTCKNYNFLDKKSNHTCVPDIAKNEIEVCLQKVKKRAREELVPIPQIYRDEMMVAKDAGLDFIVNIPELSSVKDRFYRERHKALGIDILPKKPEDITLTDEMKTHLLADDGQDDRIMVFAGTDGQLLTEATEFFMDGTFKSCCPLFDQLYTIHVDLGSTPEATCIVPAVYALLPNRREATYKRLFKLIQEKIPKFCPKKVHIDFERAAINALKDVFPKIVIKGCNFHFNQALWRKVQEIGLTTQYRDNEEVRNHIRKCAALAYLPPDYISNAWIQIMENAPNEEAVVKFNDYFVEQWMENEWLWICYNERHRTTNSVEGWHNRLNRLIGKCHPNIFELVKVLTKEINYYSIIQQRCDLYMPTPKRTKKYFDLDSRVKTILDDLHRRGDIREALNKLIYIVKFN